MSGGGNPLTRRRALKTIGTGVIGTAGLTAAGVPVEAASDGSTFSQKDTVTFDDPCSGCSGTFTLHMGVGLEVIDVDTSRQGDAFHEFRAAADVCVIDDDDGQIPVTEGEGYDDPCGDRINGHRANAKEQGVDVTLSNNDLYLSSNVDNQDEVTMSPERCSGGGVYDAGDTTALSIAADAIGLAVSSQYLTAAGLAATLLDYSADTNSDNQIRLVEYWSGEGFFRGGHQVDFAVGVPEGKSGWVNLDEWSLVPNLARAETSWDVFVDYDDVSVYG